MTALAPAPHPVRDHARLEESVRDALASARAAQPAWAATAMAERLRLLRRFRHRLADQAEEAAATVARPAAETLTAQIIPLADAGAFLERQAARLLQPRRLGRRGRPAWLWGAEAEIHREPFGVVLVLAPSNYPLFIPGTQLLQALAAGNAVILKPGVGGRPAALLLQRLLLAAGLDPRLFAVLPEDAAAGRLAVSLRPDFILLTGAAATGRAVLRQAAEAILPAAVELSGCDAVFVRADADLDRVTAALRFGLRLNDGATCIAPRRVFAHAAVFAELESRLARARATEPPIPIAAAQAEKLTPLLLAATARGAQVLGARRPEEGGLSGPVIVSRAQPAMRLLHEDVFAPVLALVEVADDRAALAAAAQCPYALGASIFSRDEAAARRLAAQVNAGVVTINDLIAPTADPRAPFGGRGDSGFGVTRGAEGLLALTRPKVVSLRRGRWLPHFEPPRAGDAALFAAALRATHACSPWARLRAGLSALRLAARRGK